MSVLPAAYAIDPEAFGRDIEESIAGIGRFVVSPSFQHLLDELYSLPIEERDAFVVNVVLNEDERLKRGIRVPKGMIVQRSFFADGRPTLFCVTKYLKDAKRKVTITFDSEVPPTVA